MHLAKLSNGLWLCGLEARRCAQALDLAWRLHSFLLCRNRALCLLLRRRSPPVQEASTQNTSPDTQNTSPDIKNASPDTKIHVFDVVAI